MKRQYWQEKPVPPAAFLGNTGDGIRMAQRVGADLWHMWHYHGTYGLRHPDTEGYPYGIRVTRFPDWTPGMEADSEDTPALLLAMKSIRMPWIVVDRTGRRYMNEYPPYPNDTGHRPMAYFDPVTQSFPRIPSYLILDRHAFEQAVRQALRDYIRLDRLADNPLTACSLIRDLSGAVPECRGRALQDLLRRHCERLQSAPKTQPLYRVLHRTYLDPARNQALAAEALYLSERTYRRRLAEAVKSVTASLWAAENELA
jgi:hypothetical protein